MGKTNIQWTDMVWNVTGGCRTVSEGCRNCWAERQAIRQSGEGKPYEGLVESTLDGPKWTGKIKTFSDRLEQPLHWKAPRKIFVNSMSDLFHEDIPFEFIHGVWATMRQTPQHTYQLLSKRPERMKEAVGLIRRKEAMGYATGFYSHVWLGVSVENRATLHRIDALRETPAAVRFLSLEPLLEDLGQIDLTGMHWVIVGGESGPGARPMHPDWVRSLRNQCVLARLPFFFKQWGTWTPVSESYIEGHYHVFDEPSEYFGQPAVNRVVMRRVGKTTAGRLLDGREWSEFPERRRLE